jgi:hypothetical protein
VTDFIQAVVQVAPIAVAAAPLPTEEGWGPVRRAVIPRDPDLQTLSQPRRGAQNTTAGAAAAQDPAALMMETKAWFHTEMWWFQISCHWELMLHSSSALYSVIFCYVLVTLDE